MCNNQGSRGREDNHVTDVVQKKIAYLACFGAKQILIRSQTTKLTWKLYFCECRDEKLHLGLKNVVI